MTTCVVALMLSIPAAQADQSNAAVSEEGGRASNLTAYDAASTSQGQVGDAPHKVVAKSPSSETCRYAQHRFLMGAVRFYSWRIRVWENKMGTGQAGLPLGHLPDCPHFLAKHLRTRAYALRAEYERWYRKRHAYYRRLYEKWRCIHEHEGAWNANNPPYHGGLQFDGTFQAEYGPEFMRRWGGAENWPVWAQLTAAERAYHGFRGWGARGFTPWPNTARMCGLL